MKISAASAPNGTEIKDAEWRAFVPLLVVLDDRPLEIKLLSNFVKFAINALRQARTVPVVAYVLLRDRLLFAKMTPWS